MSSKHVFYCLLETLEPCMYTTTIKANLLRHISSLHNSEPKTLICSTCFKSFSRKDNLKTHILNIHKKEKIYSCKTCFRRYKRFDFFERHEESCKGSKVDHCAEIMVKLEKNNTLICGKCSKYYKRADFYKSHINRCYSEQVVNHANTPIQHISWSWLDLGFTVSYEL